MSLIEIEAEKKEILRHMEALENAENRKDIDGMLALAAEDFVFVVHDRKIEGKDDIGEMLRQSAKNYISSKHTPLRIEVSSSGDVAWLLGSEKNVRERDEGIVETMQFYVITFRKVEGQWKEVVVCLA